MHINRTSRGLVGLLVATAVATGLGLCTGTAYAANPRPALKASLTATPVVAPGHTGKLNYQLTNVSGHPTSGLLLNISLPKGVSLPADGRCKNVGTVPANDPSGNAGGELVSCNVQGPSTNIAPGATLKGDNTFTVAPTAPAHAKLGRIGVLATPLNANGQPAEDWNDIYGNRSNQGFNNNVTWAWVATL